MIQMFHNVPLTHTNKEKLKRAPHTASTDGLHMGLEPIAAIGSSLDADWFGHKHIAWNPVGWIFM